MDNRPSAVSPEALPVLSPIPLVDIPTASHCQAGSRGDRRLIQDNEGELPSSLGRGSDGRSQRLACVNGSRQIPPRVRRALREKLKYKQRMRMCRQVGDKMLDSSTVEYRKPDGSKGKFDDMEVPSVEYLM